MSNPLSGATGVSIDAARAALRAASGNLGLDPTFDPETGMGGPSFADTLSDALGEFQQMQDSSKDAISAFLRGEDVELHDVMAATEEAGIAVELLIEVRNKIVDAYRTLTSMQG